MWRDRNASVRQISWKQQVLGELLCSGKGSRAAGIKFRVLLVWSYLAIFSSVVPGGFARFATIAMDGHIFRPRKLIRSHTEGLEMAG